jgi:D-alanine-D-alanine ligase
MKMKNDKVVILYNELTENPQPDELDVLDQVELVKASLTELGYKTKEITFSFSIDKTIKQIQEYDPCFIFNLVEAINNKGELCYFAPAVLNYLKIPYSGVPLEGMFITTSKILTKKLLKGNDLPTADWMELKEVKKIDPLKRYILKPIWEDGSLGLDFDSVFYGNDTGYIKKLKDVDGNKFFIEEYIEGREFNISVIGGKNGPEVLPLAEMQFIDYPEGKPKIMGYSAKWIEGTDDFHQTVRTFEYNENDKPLREKLTEICLKCWDVFSLKGYTRVDLRVDSNNNPYVLEVNANPCLSYEGGFWAASLKKGLTYKQIIEHIVEDIFR